jgi:hypothetical protein
LKIARLHGEMLALRLVSCAGGRIIAISKQLDDSAPLIKIEAKYAFLRELLLKCAIGIGVIAIGVFFFEKILLKVISALT